MRCPTCGLYKVNVGLPGESMFVCLEGCQDLTKILPIADLLKASGKEA